MAVLIRLGFFGLLRPGEIGKLKRRDLKLGTLADGMQVAIVALIDPKNRAAMGRAQFTTISDPGTVRWLAWYIEQVPGHCNLWPYNLQKFRELFKILVQNLGLERFNFTLGSLRPGGTTHLFILGAEVPRLQFLGRWRSQATLSSYVQEVMAQMVWIGLTRSEESQVLLAQTSFKEIWLTPPQCSLTGLAVFPPTWRRSPTATLAKRFSMQRRS